MVLDDLGDYKPQPHPVEYDLGAVPITTPQEISDYPLTLQPEAPGSSLNQMIADSFTAKFFEDLDDMPPCCLETLGKASENLAVLERDLIRRAAETLDEARAAANELNGAGLGRAGVLNCIANSYRDLAQAAS